MNQKMVPLTRGMGTLAQMALVVLAGAGLVGCEEADKPAVSAPKARSQAVIAPAGSGAPTAKKQAESAGEQEVVKKPRTLCTPLEGKERRSVAPEASISQATAPGESALGKSFPVGKGKVTWVNFWAAWCVPCKEEIPRLLAWEKTLSREGKAFELVFVSLDDDERQLQDFLKQQGADGMRRTYWLREGSQRQEWLSKVGMDSDPRLPAHLVVSARGETHCVIDGAVEDDDLPEVRKLVDGAS